MKEYLAKAEHLNVKYKNIHAVKDVSFTIGPGEIVALIGPNGSGKTSTVECLEGLRSPASGRVEIFGQNPFTHKKSIYTRLGVQLQDVEYPEKIRVWELCSLFASFYERPADWKLLLQQLGLEQRAKCTVKKLSGGEKQRLSILLALLPRPRLLILDELTTGLDPEIRRGMWESLKQIRGFGAGILLVSHYMDEVEALADRILFMEKGQAPFCGTQEAFRLFARSRIPKDQWQECLSLEALCLLLFPRSNLLTMEGII